MKIKVYFGYDGCYRVCRGDSVLYTSLDGNQAMDYAESIGWKPYTRDGERFCDN